jgi:Flp pilus assembly protein TadG
MECHAAHSTNSTSFGMSDLRHLASDEDGAAYTLSYVMVVPVYALLMCLIIETCLMLTAKLGTVYAAYAAARTASVWSAHTTWEKAERKAQKAAIKTMAPFSSGTQPLRSNLPTEGSAKDIAIDAGAYWAAYQVYAKEPVANTYLLSKYGYAVKHLKVKIEGPPATWDADITAKVTYEFPFNVPGIGRLLGREVDGRYYFAITSQATIPNEGPQNGRNTIGIGYGKLQ